MHVTPRHPLLERILDAWQSLPDDWPDGDPIGIFDPLFAEEIAELGDAGFLAFLFRETKGNMATTLLLRFPGLLQRLDFEDILLAAHLLEEDDLACYHFIPALAQYMGIDVLALTRTRRIHGLAHSHGLRMNPDFRPTYRTVGAWRESGVDLLVFMRNMEAQGAPVLSIEWE